MLKISCFLSCWMFCCLCWKLITKLSSQRKFQSSRIEKFCSRKIFKTTYELYNIRGTSYRSQIIKEKKTFLNVFVQFVRDMSILRSRWFLGRSTKMNVAWKWAAVLPLNNQACRMILVIFSCSMFLPPARIDGKSLRPEHRSVSVQGRSDWKRVRQMCRGL